MAKTAFITMDVESFYDTSCVKERISPRKENTCKEQVKEFLDILDERGIKATLFVVGEFLADCKEYLQKAVSRGHEIAVHAYSHISPSKRTEEEFVSDLIKAKTLIETELGVKVSGYRAPCFGIDDRKAEILKSNGFIFDSSAMCAAADNDLSLSGYEKTTDLVYTKDGFWEFALPTERFFGHNVPICGGGYLRLAPWRLNKKLFSRAVKKEKDYVLYLHPFELFSGKLPKIDGLKSSDRYYINAGRKRFGKKIKYILDVLSDSGYRFYGMKEYIDEHYASTRS